ncbi:MAG: acetyl-CoA carboxylase biotin carboxyl carrier protein [Candidatus Liberibacter europaeus]|uniref:Biotin carboxyl carrier protein of acetyl-CoA carboxylase n=1 Tax=Candidatus Liberibacter europaeus TaxID=744859 RepID=A0A2T4VY29_9HYPH|nr:acetyl-CoA carboxylase biotin carboxyl carrier protein [Candidatus Liberibacter europaeus]PTL86675.1 MAG: acetyl-CoA carboxylase biotin carboxyl carrier protein [Candidatus Liberibacter europaeus]
MTDKKQKINLTMIRNLANILNETNLTEVEIDSDGTHIRLLRSPQKTTITSYCPPEEENAIQITESSKSKTLTSATSKSDIYPLNLHTVKSPMVGTAYIASSPGSKPFVEQGSIVQKGQTLLIIEAMKTMNHIVAPCSGKIHDIDVKDGQLVEYDETLIVLECEEEDI